MHNLRGIRNIPYRIRSVYYGWWFVVLTGFIMTIATVPLYHAMTVWSVALESHFGWSRTQLGFALTLTRIEGGIMGPVEGYLTDKFGTRRMVLVGLLLLGVGFLIFSQVQNLWMFYLAFVVMALGQGLGSWLPLMTGINHWFIRMRATAMGWGSLGSRLGALVLVPVIAWAIDPDKDRFGWELTALVLGIFILIVAVPVSKAIRNHPQDYGLLPDGDDPISIMSTSDTLPSQIQQADLTAKQAIRTSAFWLIAFGHGFTSMVILAIMTHLGLLLKDRGFDVQTTGWIVAAYTAVAMIFQLVGGYTGDKAPKNIVLFFFTTLQAIGVVVLTYANTLPMFYLFAALFGAGFGGRNPLTVAIRGEYFGRSSFGKILGLSTVPMNILLLISSPLAGYIRDVQGDYKNAFLLLAVLNLVGGFLFLFAKRPIIKVDISTS